ncbi:hypothetical protein FQA39_LY08375 [Lamprigera yunnana]|nr:hypothetical protein FQA39_LY08375 [Lamprigera yunnana]
MNTSVVKIPPITMSKLYIGNLPVDTNEMILRQLFLEQNLACTNILVKRGGYAFVDCPDQSSADKAIDKLNGTTEENYSNCKKFKRLTAYVTRKNENKSKHDTEEGNELNPTESNKLCTGNNGIGKYNDMTKQRKEMLRQKKTKRENDENKHEKK